jgi:hypothetical protein
MATIIPFPKHAGFDADADTTKAMGEAYDAACKEMNDTGQPDLVKEIIAKWVVDIAATGERDPKRLCIKVLIALGINRV